MNRKQVFLFLQGLASPLFARLADELEARGHSCVRVNFCPGDRLFWPRPGSMDYHARYDEWPSYLREVIQVHNVTDVILFGETRPLHHLAATEAKHAGCRLHVFEEGYLRPYWLTIDSDGTNGNSMLPRDAEFYLSRETPGNQPANSAPAPISAANRALWNILYQAANLCFPWSHPHYQTHRPCHPLHEALGWLRRLIRRFVLGQKFAHESKLQSFLAGNRPFFLLPLQLDSDTQIITHADFSEVGEFMDLVMSSFARHAPAETWLVVKCHPLDNDLTRRDLQTLQLAARHGISERVLYVDGGHLPTLLAKALGVVTINSTVGTSAFDHGCPVKALGRAIYNFAGLADQQPLESFWTNPQKPDRRVHAAFRNFLFESCLVPGSFYSKQGIAMGVQAAADLLEKRARANPSPHA